MRRAGRRVAAGFERSPAERVARDPRFDVHALIATARRILAPLDGPW